MAKNGGADLLHQLDPDGSSVMHWAAYSGNLEIANYLVDLNLPYDSYESHRSQQHPIHWACVKGDIDMVNYLCKLIP